MSNNRPETCAMKFGDDHAGLFIRGDDCYYYAMQLQTIFDSCMTDVRERMTRDPYGPNSFGEELLCLRQIENLIQLLHSSLESVENELEPKQILKPFDDCL